VDPAISVVLPAYDEAARLGPTLERILGFLAARGEPFELVVVDDGSRDATAAVATRYGDRGARLVRLERNRGKGAALRAGVAATRGGRVLLCDADLSTPIEDLERLEPRLADAEVVLGSRAVADSRILRRQPRHRELMGKVFNRLIRLLGIGGLSDTQCGFKLLDGGVARRLFAELTVDRFAYDVELVWLARRRGYRVVEVGVTWRDEPASKVHAVRDAASMLLDVLRFRRRHRGAPRRGL
jgi:dolichyl-phosphate beta-glucosyltransferase